jgi:DNA-binding GntR family transcriptional regulator
MGSSAGELSDKLRVGILRGELGPGAPLRQEQLASALGVSKIPVREALQWLAAEGLATFEANRGFSVATLTPDGATEIYRLRAAIEPLLLERSIPRLTIVDLANWHYHRSLYSPAGWERGLRLVRTLHASVAPYLLAYLQDPKAAAASATQHQELLEHCRAGDVAPALAVLDAHLSMARTSLVENLSAEEGARASRASQ